MAPGTRPNTGAGIVSMIATHSWPASSAGAMAAPLGRPDPSGMSRVDTSSVPAKAAKYGKSLRQSLARSCNAPNSRVRSGWMR
ncbi:hypothetical protein ABIA43_002456 [Bradyrhizobium sp. USDA 328]